MTGGWLNKSGIDYWLSLCSSGHDDLFFFSLLIQLSLTIHCGLSHIGFKDSPIVNHVILIKNRNK